MECDDGKTYLVKFAGPTKAAVNELVGQSLARLVGLPVPESALVEVPESMVDGARDLRSRGIRPGTHHGTEMISGALELGQFLRGHPGSGLSNEAVLPLTICHDNWILTRDRDRDDNHLVHRLDGGFRYVMVDFSHGFTGPDWTADSIEQGSYLRVLMPVHPTLAWLVVGLSSFEPALKPIEAVSDSQIESIVAAVPAEWGLTEDESSCLSGFLETRRGLLREVLSSSRGRFPNWKG